MYEDRARELVPRANLIGEAAAQSGEHLRWNGFSRSENLVFQKTKERSVVFQRANDWKTVIIFDDFRITRWGRFDSTIRVGKRISDDYESFRLSPVSRWRSFAEFIRAAKGEARHDLSLWFRAYPLSSEFIAELEQERDRDFSFLDSLKK